MNICKPLLIGYILFLIRFQGQSQEIAGRVTNSNEKPVPFATIGTIRLPDSMLVKVSYADSTGFFRVIGLSQGMYLFEFSATGHIKATRHVNLRIGEKTDMGLIQLESSHEILNEVVVSGSRPVIKQEGERMIVIIAGSAFFKTATNGFDVLKRVPGISIDYDGSLQFAGRLAPAIFIDGKPSPMGQQELSQFLQTLTPDMIASVELINNPSAIYDGEHKAIIDIRLKKDQALGWKGMASSTMQANNYAFSEHSLLLSFKSPGTALTIRAGLTEGSKIYRYAAWQYLANGNFMHTKNAIATNHHSYNVSLGFDHTFSTRHRLELQLRTTQNNRDIDGFGTIHTTGNNPAGKESLIGTNNLSAPKQSNYGVNLNYTGRYGNTQVQWFNNFLAIDTRQAEDIQSREAPNQHPLHYWITRLANSIRIVSTQLDFSTERRKTRLRYGGRFAYSNTDNDSRYDTLQNAGYFVPDSGRSNAFKYREYISAGYFSLESSAGRFAYSFGLRAEHTSTVANTLTLKQITRRNYLQWLPSASISYRQGKHQFRLSFSRKLTRPGFWELNPFRIYNSPLNYFTGNPYLLPSLTSTLNFNWNRSPLTINFTIGREDQPLGRYPRYDRVTNVLEYLGRNLDYRSFAGLEFSLPYEIAHWWKINHTISLNYKKERTPYFEYNFAIPVKDLTVSGSQVFTLPYKINFDLFYFYRTRSGNSLYIFRPLYYIDLGLQRAWFGGKLNTKVNFHDIFNNYRLLLIFREKQLINNTLSHWPGMQRFALTISYSFGRSTYKAGQATKTEEESRTQ